MNLFQKVDIILNSGQKSDFKIECDALTDEDIETFAYLIQKKYKFGKVLGVPRGGVGIQVALEKYVTQGNDTLLIVDDVLTTGGSMVRFRENYLTQYENIVGVVLFARNECPDWIDSVFKMW